MSKTYRRQPRYDHEFKLQVVELILSGQMSSPEVRKLYGIGSSSTVWNWIQEFGPQRSKEKVSELSKKDPKLLMEQIKALEAQLKLEKIRNEGLNFMIDLAEKEQKVSIRKKGSTKQSGK